eukprot:CAMPEP_0205934370 /NCGR_PEP_ID=MMETSP1325-20131115/36214_1 /ASSEMBLY_ACC=CAM_ASM_000708 /TAXON_ID=236786 /ORGANISM="Florenciella sp., Strain RCC1007" /LENGTH=76 /DNA_ID=CAMNT_0053304343 /DNA_START=63 /DNA_END=293 /DNA_ORIENTATION=+
MILQVTSGYFSLMALASASSLVGLREISTISMPLLARTWAKHWPKPPVQPVTMAHLPYDFGSRTFQLNLVLTSFKN